MYLKSAEKKEGVATGRILFRPIQLVIRDAAPRADGKHRYEMHFASGPCGEVYWSEEEAAHKLGTVLSAAE